MKTPLRAHQTTSSRLSYRPWWLVLLLCLASAGAWAQTVTIGSTAVPVVAPATSSYLYGPIYRSANDAGSTFNYSRYAHLYTAAELGIPAGAVITQLEWLKANAGQVTGNNTYKVWLENSTQTTLGTTQTWGAISATPTLVYSSTTQQVTGAAGTYFSVTLNQPFTYSGGSLLLLTDWEKQGSASDVVNFVTNPATGMGLGAANSAALTNTTSLTTTYGNRRPTLRVTYTPGSPCTAPPTAGITLASATSVCAGSSVGLSLQGASYGQGQTYQWQSSANGATYTDIAGATNPTYSVASLTATRYFRAVLTCSGQSASSTPVQVTVNAATYAALPVTESFEGAWVDGCDTRDVPSNSWRNNPGTGNASWRRDDDGTSAAWTSPTVGVYTPTGSQGTRSARFHSYYAGAGAAGTLDLYVNMSAAGNKVMTFDYVNTAGNDSLFIQLSTDGGQTFGAPLLRLANSGTAAQGFVPQAVSFATTSATAVIRFRTKVTTTFTSDIGIDNVAVEVLSGVPNCAINLSPANNATGVLRPVTISWSSGGGVATSYDVYFGTTSTPTFVGNQTGTTFTPTGNLAGNTDYYYQIVPRNANGAATGCAVNKFTTSNTFTYCNTNLGAWCGAGNANITTVAILNTSLNNAGTTCNVVNGSGYTAYPASGSTTAVLNPGMTYQLSVTTPESGIISVWIDYNQNGTFEAAEWTQVATASPAGQPATVAITIPVNAAVGQTGLRVRSRLVGNANGAGDACANMGSGETEDYIVTIAPAAPCTAPPTAGAATASSTNICAPRAITLGLQGASFGQGLTYQWQSSANGTTYTDIAGATNLTYTTAPITATTYFRAVLTCSGQSATSTPVQVTLGGPTFATLPVIESFENSWASICATNDAPNNSWRSTASATDVDASWRRDDDGASAGWTSPTFGAYTPTGSQGTRSARFHSGYASAGTIGLLDLYVNLSQAGNKRLTFDFLNTSGTDSLTVHLSTDGGATFGPALLRLNQAATWSNQALPLTTTSATVVIRFRARGDFGSTDIGLDNVRLESATGCLSPAGLTVSSTTTTSAVLNWVAGGTGTYTVEYGPIGFTPGQGTTVSGISGTTTTLTGLTPGTPYQFYVTQSCGTATSPAGGPVVFNTQIVNDNPSGAVTLTVGTNCTPTNSTTVGATTTTANGYTNPGTAPNNCGIAGTPRDVWFQFTTAASGPTSTAVRIRVTGVPASQLRAFSSAGGANGPFTQIGCSSVSSTSAAPDMDLTNLTPSTTYFVRVSGYGSTDPLGAFTICASLLPNCPAPITPAAPTVTSNSATLTWGGTQSAGASYIVEYGRQGFVLGQGTTVSGISGQTTTLTGLTDNTQYCFYVKQDCGSTNGQSNWAGPVCFRTDVAPATNDEPCAAIGLTVTGSGRIVTTSGTTLGATTTTVGGISSQLPACAPAFAPRDVWFTMTLPAGQTSVTMAVNGSTVGMVRVFTAANCSTSFQQVACQASTGSGTGVGIITFSGLSAGTRYYVAVSGYGSNDPQGTFTIGDVLATATQLAGGQVDVFPNPVMGSGWLNVRISGAKAGAVRYELVNALGQVVLARTAAVQNGVVDQQLPTAGMAKGLYHLRLSAGTSILIKKVMIN